MSKDATSQLGVLLYQMLYSRYEHTFFFAAAQIKVNVRRRLDIAGLSPCLQPHQYLYAANHVVGVKKDGTVLCEAQG